MNAPRERVVDRPRTNAELREEATGRMLSTAIRLIAQKGASRLSLVDVGRESGYSHSLPNYYFKTKKHLLLEVYAFIVGSFRIRSRAWIKEHMPQPIRPGIGNLEASVRGYLALATTDDTRSRAMHALWSESLSSMPELLEEVGPSNRRNLAMFEQQIRAGIQRGEIDPEVDVEALAVLVMGVLRGAVWQKLVDPGRVDLDRVSDTVVCLLRNGLIPASPAPSPSTSPSSSESSEEREPR